MVKHLAQNGGDINIKTKGGQTPAEYAKSLGCMGILEFLEGLSLLVCRLSLATRSPLTRRSSRLHALVEHGRAQFRASLKPWISLKPSTTAPIPAARYYHAFCLVDDGKLFIYGGSSSEVKKEDTVFHSDTWLLDSSRKWQAAKFFPKPPALSGAVAVSASRNAYLVGGIDEKGEYNPHVYQFDFGARKCLSTEAISEDNPIIKAVHHTASFINRSIVVFGGLTDERNPVSIFSLST